MASFLHRAIATLERRIDAVRARRRPPRDLRLDIYAGYRSDSRVYVSARVLGGAPARAPGAGFWERLRAMLSIYESDEVPGIAVRVSTGGSARTFTSDDEGYVHAQIACARPRGATTTWETVELTLPGEVPCPARVLVPGTATDFGVISDIDDTILETGATDFLRNWRRVLVERPEDRCVVPGAPALYRALCGDARRPLFFVSSSPWNLYPYLARFMALNAFPAGPMFLRDYGIDERKFIHGDHGAHKRAAIDHLLTTYRGLRFALVGDSGQADVRVYTDVATAHPDRIAAVLIRDLGGDSAARHREHFDRLRAVGVPLWVAADFTGGAFQGDGFARALAAGA